MTDDPCLTECVSRQAGKTEDRSRKAQDAGKNEGGKGRMGEGEKGGRRTQDAGKNEGGKGRMGEWEKEGHRTQDAGKKNDWEIGK